MRGTEKLDALLKNFVEMERGPAGCALTVRLGEEILYEGYQGYADEGAGKKIGRDTVYRMYSCTKPITAAAAMILLEEGKILLDDPVWWYLPEYKNLTCCHYAGNNMETLIPAADMTIKHLLTMTSGFTYDGECNGTQRETKKVLDVIKQEGFVSTREFAGRLARVPLAFQPGSHWNYGLGLDVMGAVIEEASGMGFGEFLKKRLFEPLEMPNTGFFKEEIPREQLAVMYRYQDGKRLPNESEEYKFSSVYRLESGGGGLLSTVEDMSHFAGMMAKGGIWKDKRILNYRSIELMSRNHLRGEALEDFQDTHRHGWNFMYGYGYGLGVKTLIDLADSNCLGSSGEFSWAGAAGTLLSMDPVNRLSVVYAHQLMPDNREEFCHPRILNAVYSII